MKQFLVLLSMVFLGLALYALIAGPGEESLYHALQSAWKGELLLR